MANTGTADPGHFGYDRGRAAAAGHLGGQHPNKATCPGSFP